MNNKEYEKKLHKLNINDIWKLVVQHFNADMQKKYNEEFAKTKGNIDKDSARKKILIMLAVDLHNEGKI